MPKRSVSGRAALALAALSLPAAARAAVPEVSVVYEGLFERYCAELTGAPREAAVEAELTRRLPEFQSAWRAAGPPLLAAVVELTGTPFAFRDAEAALHLCRNTASMSTPLLIAVRPFMRTAGDDTRPLPLYVNTLFHEILHRYLRDARGPTTPLMEKYAGEPWPVRNHLHLFALEELAYRQLGREAELPPVVAKDRPNATLTRARAIVAAEGATAFLAEIRRPRAAVRKERN